MAQEEGIETRPLVIGGAIALLATIVVVIALVVIVQRDLAQRDEVEGAMQYSSAGEVDPQRAAQSGSEVRWVDAKTGVVAIPVDLAMKKTVDELVARRRAADKKTTR